LDLLALEALLVTPARRVFFFSSARIIVRIAVVRSTGATILLQRTCGSVIVVVAHGVTSCRCFSGVLLLVLPFLRSAIRLDGLWLYPSRRSLFFLLHFLQGSRLIHISIVALFIVVGLRFQLRRQQGQPRIIVVVCEPVHELHGGRCVHLRQDRCVEAHGAMVWKNSA
jgi:hypothetical protein